MSKAGQTTYEVCKQYNSSMCLDEVILCLKNGKTSSYNKPILIGIPTISFIIFCLQKIAKQYNQIKLQQSAFNCAIQTITKQKPLNLNENDFQILKPIVKFYNECNHLITKCYKKINNSYNNQDLWYKIQKILIQYQKMQQQLSKAKQQLSNIQRQLQCKKNQHQKTIRNLNKNILSPQYKQVMIDLYKKLFRGEIKNYQTHKNYYKDKIPFLEDIMAPVVENSNNLIIIQQKLKKLSGSNQFDNNSLIDTMKKHFQYMEKSNNQLDQRTPPSQKQVKKFPNQIKYPLSTTQQQLILDTQTKLIYQKASLDSKRCFQDYRNMGQKLKDANISENILQPTFCQFVKIKQILDLLCRIFYISKEGYIDTQECYYGMGDTINQGNRSVKKCITLLDRCQYIVKKIADVINEKYKQVDNNLATKTYQGSQNIQQLFHQFKRFQDQKNKQIQDLQKQVKQRHKQFQHNNLETINQPQIVQQKYQSQQLFKSQLLQQIREYSKHTTKDTFRHKFKGVNLSQKRRYDQKNLEIVVAEVLEAVASVMQFQKNFGVVQAIAELMQYRRDYPKNPTNQYHTKQNILLNQLTQQQQRLNSLNQSLQSQVQKLQQSCKIYQDRLAQQRIQKDQLRKKLNQQLAKYDLKIGDIKTLNQRYMGVTGQHKEDKKRIDILNNKIQQYQRNYKQYNNNSQSDKNTLKQYELTISQQKLLQEQLIKRQTQLQSQLQKTKKQNQILVQTLQKKYKQKKQKATLLQYQIKVFVDRYYQLANSNLLNNKFQTHKLEVDLRVNNRRQKQQQAQTSLTTVLNQLQTYLNNYSKYQRLLNLIYQKLIQYRITYLKNSKMQKELLSSIEVVVTDQLTEKKIKYIQQKMFLDDKQINVNTNTIRIQDKSKTLALAQPQSQPQQPCSQYSDHHNFVSAQLHNYLQSHSLHPTRLTLLHRCPPTSSLPEWLSLMPNTLLLARIPNNHVIGIYSSMSYSETRNLGRTYGLLISTHGGQSYAMKAGAKGGLVGYDREFVVYGGGLVRIHKWDCFNGVTINFQCFNQIFQNPKNQDARDIFLTQNQKLQVQMIQIYQIQLKDQKIIELQNPVYTKIQQQRNRQEQKKKIKQPQKNQQKIQIEKIENKNIDYKKLQQQDKKSVPIKGNTASNTKAITELKEKIARYQKSIMQLKKDKQQLQKKNKQLETKLQNSQKHQKTTTGKVTPIPQKNKQDQSQAASQKKLQELRRKLEGVQTQLNNKNMAINTAEDRIRKLQAENKDIQAQIQKSKQSDENKEILTKMKKIQKAYDQIVIQNQRLKSDCEKYNYDYEQIKRELQTLRTQNVNKINSYQEQQKTLTKQIQDLKKNNQSLALQIKSIQQKSKQQNQQFILNKQNQDAINQANDKKQFKSGDQQIRLKLQQSENQNQKLKTKMRQLQQQVKNLQQKFSLKSEQLDSKQLLNQQQQKQKEQKGQQQLKPTQSQNASKKLAIDQATISLQIYSQSQKLGNLKQFKFKSQEQKAKQVDMIISSTINYLIIETQKMIKQYEYAQRIKKHQKELDNIKKQLTQLQKSRDKLNQQIQEKNNILRQEQPTKFLALPKSPAKLATQPTPSQQQNPSARQIQKSKKQVEKIKKQIFFLSENLSNLKKQISAKQAQIIKLNQSERKVRDSIANMDARLKEVIDREEKLKEMEEECKATINQLKSKQIQLGKLTKDIQELKDQKLSLQRQVTNIKFNLGQLQKLQNSQTAQQKKLQQLKAQISRKQQQLQRMKKSLKQAQSQQEQKANKLTENIKRYEQMEKNVRAVVEKLEWQEKQMRKRKVEMNKELALIRAGQMKFGYANRLFVGEVLEHQDDREFIVQTLQEGYPKLNIKSSKLLYSFPLMKGLNPHDCVDDHPHYILLIRMSNISKQHNKKHILAMYSEKQLSKNSNTNNGYGFVSAVTNKRSYYLRESTNVNPRLTEYNQYYFVYGNSELRFKINQNKIDGNIGHNFRSLDTGQLKTPEEFTGSANETSVMECYEFYQIIFEEKPK